MSQFENYRSRVWTLFLFIVSVCRLSVAQEPAPPRQVTSITPPPSVLTFGPIVTDTTMDSGAQPLLHKITLVRSLQTAVTPADCSTSSSSCISACC
jgi:hypothetical protein